MKKTKKLKLKKGVKIILLLIACIFTIILITKALNRFERNAHFCDIEQGYTCSIEEVQEYIKNNKNK